MANLIQLPFGFDSRWEIQRTRHQNSTTVHPVNPTIQQIAVVVQMQFSKKLAAFQCYLRFRKMPSDTLWEIANKSFHIWCAGHSQWVYMHIYIPNHGPPQKESNWWPCYKFWHQITLSKFPHLQQLIVVTTSQLQMDHTCPEGVWGCSLVYGIYSKLVSANWFWTQEQFSAHLLQANLSRESEPWVVSPHLDLSNKPWCHEWIVPVLAVQSLSLCQEFHERCFLLSKVCHLLIMPQITASWTQFNTSRTTRL